MVAIETPLRHLAGQVGGSPAFSIKSHSERFYDLVVHSNSLIQPCDACGRVHFCDDPNQDWDEGEYEDLQEKKKSHFEIYIPHHNSVSWGDLLDLEIVALCQCNFMGWFEQQFNLPKEISSDRFWALMEELESDEDRLNQLLALARLTP